MIHLSEEDLILLYYGETGAPDFAQAHLAECPTCRDAAESLARALGVCNEITAPERPPDFGRDVWMQLAPQLGSQYRPKHLFPLRIWLSAAALAILLVAVFVAGRLSRPSPAPVMAGLSDRARERILDIAVADHLDRVQMLLTEIADGNGGGTGSFDADRERAEDLVQEDRLLRQSLASRGETATTNFLYDVETVLTEAAHTSDSAAAPYVGSAQALGELRNRIESGSLLFKVRIVESNLRNEDQKL